MTSLDDCNIELHGQLAFATKPNLFAGHLRQIIELNTQTLEMFRCI